MMDQLTWTFYDRIETEVSIHVKLEDAVRRRKRYPGPTATPAQPPLFLYQFEHLQI